MKKIKTDQADRASYPFLFVLDPSYPRYAFSPGAPTRYPTRFNSSRAITILWISLVPSPIVHSFTSR